MFRYAEASKSSSLPSSLAVSGGDHGKATTPDVSGDESVDVDGAGEDPAEAPEQSKVSRLAIFWLAS